MTRSGTKPRLLAHEGLQKMYDRPQMASSFTEAQTAKLLCAKHGRWPRKVPVTKRCLQRLRTPAGRMLRTQLLQHTLATGLW